ncbi:MAG: hypothetical protein Q8L75_19370 [Acidobacteriota bacterium]|nr:hypothetical protein [Acidobacteriota bacterium]
MTETERIVIALLQRIATAAEQQASDTQAIKSQIHGFVQSVPVHLRDVYAALEKRR